MSRFDYVAYDKTASEIQAEFKAKVIELEQMIDRIPIDRWREAALMKLEETYMCIGKGIRDDQIERNGSAPLQEGRSNG